MVPFGSIFFAWSTLMAVAPIRRPRRLALLSWICSCAPNEVPFLFLAIVVASTVPTVGDGDVASPGSGISVVLALLTSAGLIVVARRALRSGPSLDQALGDALGPGWRGEIDPAQASRLRRHLPWLRILLAPWPFQRHDVERIANIPYGENGTTNLLDLYRHRSHPSGAPTLIYLHGGGFRGGRKSWEARPLIHRLASQGWTCISANYHLAPSPAEGFPEHLIDVKRVIAWARTEGHPLGVDPDTIFLAGSSAGAHLTAMAAFTANDPTLQPGFEESDTSITGAIGLYGYYGPLGGSEQPSSTPLAHVGPSAPPFLVVHGDQDTFTPVEGARVLVERLQAVSSHPVVYAELPGAQHSFDLFHSIRFEAVVDAVEAFAAWVRTQPPVPRWPREPRCTPAPRTRGDDEAA